LGFIWGIFPIYDLVGCRVIATISCTFIKKEMWRLAPHFFFADKMEQSENKRTDKNYATLYRNF
jgi:hypothetical protein